MRDHDDPMRIRLEKKYMIRNKRFGMVIEKLKQNFSTLSQMIKRYTERVEQYTQNRMFINSQKWFCYSLQKLEISIIKKHQTRKNVECFGMEYGVNKQCTIPMQNG